VRGHPRTLPARPDESVVSPSLGDAGSGGEPLTIPASREVTEERAQGWRRRGIEVDLVQHGRSWVLVEA
jgi:hypothetical protein